MTDRDDTRSGPPDEPPRRVQRPPAPPTPGWPPPARPAAPGRGAPPLGPPPRSAPGPAARAALRSADTPRLRAGSSGAATGVRPGGPGPAAEVPVSSGSGLPAAVPRPAAGRRATGRHRPATGTARRRATGSPAGLRVRSPPVYGPPGAAGLRHRPGARADRRTGRPRAAGGVVGWAAVDQRGRGGRLAPGHRRRLLGARRARRRRRRRVRSARRVRAGHHGSHRPLGPGHDAARRVLAGRPRPGGHAARGARHGRRHLHAAAERRPRTLPRAVRQGPVLGRRGVGHASGWWSRPPGCPAPRAGA